MLENEQQQQQGLTLDILEMSNLHPRGEDPTTPALSLPTGPEIWQLQSQQIMKQVSQQSGNTQGSLSLGLCYSWEQGQK